MWLKSFTATIRAKFEPLGKGFRQKFDGRDRRKTAGRDMRPRQLAMLSLENSRENECRRRRGFSIYAVGTHMAIRGKAVTVQIFLFLWACFVFAFWWSMNFENCCLDLFANIIWDTGEWLRYVRNLTWEQNVWNLQDHMEHYKLW